ncbi:MAG: hypothetical protein A3F26_02150 [Candidatus Ryanbacteria bacterium RIFCSPHIGHO2_12_FULL_47_12b]|uniref:Methyltransferase domain-containing protein n=2 Tax=Candidatus Ryaniibacteriota TaxID=1817914 RepID=A0A1G2H6S0_9BACT|nr:MAG: rRNA (Adenine-N6-)-methyltransferase [Parcubacteria group bacterium GW2011_GWA2_47_10b]OGZ46666.1 MAG: hypothetical protein A2844_00885 [Candidatus Ryanbacteria bacterium RIFCSPHIGHO2_01_FULL_48_80]OGZ53044.1 MAG: hypothetical protein A3A29_01210 [Candidatus Ryanbacteria bacterium RIFCSPLOWO2_01_FULL_47_79]OGZ53367.1 MAG: hypothetical protein A3F26_02150 [Candidatus Ryanbacteria bacterium RIFCSPHIGHO2_12_FULL_47_12b]OGZ57046.1 MAG: hypothetical protein A3J04_00590 [Candidatus Ryanbacter
MRSFAKLEELIEECDLYGPLAVADFGAGAGYFAIPIAKKLSENGTVYAFDIQEPPLEALRKRARDFGLHNIETLRADLERPQGTKLRAESVDFIVIANILFQTQNKNAMLAEAFRVLKKGGRILFVEWNDGLLGTPGPRPQHRVTPQALKEYIASFHCIIEKEFTLGEHHYGVIAKKQ